MVILFSKQKVIFIASQSQGIVVADALLWLKIMPISHTSMNLNFSDEASRIIRKWNSCSVRLKLFAYRYVYVYYGIISIIVHIMWLCLCTGYPIVCSTWSSE